MFYLAPHGFHVSTVSISLDFQSFDVQTPFSFYTKFDEL